MYLVCIPLLSCLLSPLLPSLSLAFLSLTTLPLIFPRSHQALLISLPLCSHFCLSNTSPPVFFFLSVSGLILPHTLLLPEALLCPGCCCCNDTNKLFGRCCGLSLICLCLLSSHTRTSPSLCRFLHLEKAAANVNSDGHKDCRTPTKYTHTSCLH